MSNKLKKLVSLGALLAVAACGGTTTTIIDNTPTFTRDLIAFSNGSDARRADPLSTAGAVANASGVYTGDAQIAVLGGGPTATYLGTANLTANIATGRVTGNLGSFRGGTDQANPETMTGSIKVSGDTLGTSSASRFTSNFAGQLTGPQTTVVLSSGTMSGDFRNSPTDGLFASGTTNATVNGTPGRAAVLNVVADKQ